MAVKVNANPAMIKWAREDAGFSLDELPQSLKKAEKWESGEEKPTWNDLRNLAKKYKRPSFFYFLKKPPVEENQFIEFRSDEKIDEFSSSLRLEIRKAKFRRTAYIRIHEDQGINLNNFNKYVVNEKNPLKLAKHIRNYLNIDIETQQEEICENNRKYDDLNYWKELCFDFGILVFEMDQVPETEISGCSIYYDNCPIILLNGKNNYNHRIFTLIHELAHLTQGVSAICDINKHNKKEAFCNKVALEILIPKDTFGKNELFTKKGNFKLGLLSKEKTKNSNPKLSISARKKNYDGIPYIRLVLNAYNNEIITSTQAMRYLDTSLDNFEKISNEVGDKGGFC